MVLDPNADETVQRNMLAADEALLREQLAKLQPSERAAFRAEVAVIASSQPSPAEMFQVDVAKRWLTWIDSMPA